MINQHNRLRAFETEKKRLIVSGIDKSSVLGAMCFDYFDKNFYI